MRDVDYRIPDAARHAVHEVIHMFTYDYSKPQENDTIVDPIPARDRNWDNVTIAREMAKSIQASITAILASPTIDGALKSKLIAEEARMWAAANDGIISGVQESIGRVDDIKADVDNQTKQSGEISNQTADQKWQELWGKVDKFSKDADALLDDYYSPEQKKHLEELQRAYDQATTAEEKAKAALAITKYKTACLHDAEQKTDDPVRKAQLHAKADEGDTLAAEIEKSLGRVDKQQGKEVAESFEAEVSLGRVDKQQGKEVAESFEAEVSLGRVDEKQAKQAAESFEVELSLGRVDEKQARQAAWSYEITEALGGKGSDKITHETPVAPTFPSTVIPIKQNQRGA